MKNILFSFFLIVCFVVNTGFTSVHDDSFKKIEGALKIVNDTKQDIYVFTGQAHVMLYHGGGSTSVTCEAGRKIYRSDKGKKGSLIFTIDETMCGKTVKLSAYL
ncbi:hypothetical protein AD998_13405 [bacterium 336/3]|jgi:hypothetical protein|nr:hypothetical protein AD998_13405 [bacterium 336/3]